MKFSVIIPTLQRSHRLRGLVDQYAAHPRVGEVLVINNAPEPLEWASPKVRVLQQERNIYVNPAWNLGAREAKEDLLLISNDDITPDARMLGAAWWLLKSSKVGIVGPSPAAFDSGRSGRLWARPVYGRRYGYGTWMAMRRCNYIPVPEELRIFHGDDWLFYGQTRRNLQLRGVRVETEMSTTSGAAGFVPAAAGEGERYLALQGADDFRARYRRRWRYEIGIFGRLQEAWETLRGKKK